jgi:uncharacterized protein
MHLKISPIFALLAGLFATNVSVVAQPKPAAPATAFAEEATSLTTPTGDLHGTLTVPTSKPRFPVALILVGSGPDDRDGNAPVMGLKTNSYKLLAEALAARGVASLRYDKRGVGQSIKALAKPSDARFDDFVADAVLWATKLRGDKRLSTLTIVGHSEGSLIGIITALKTGADGFVSLAGLGRNAGQALLDQIKPTLTPELYQSAEQIIGQLSSGKTVETVPDALKNLFHPTLQPYLISYFKYDPAREIARLAIPILIIQGTTDADVTVQDAKLLAAAKSSARLVLIEGMSHPLKHAALTRADQVKAYSDPSLPLEAQLIDEAANFVKQIRKRSK